MKYILNETPLKTTNNFKINNISTSIDFKETLFNKFKYNKKINVKESIKDNFISKIGLSNKKYYLNEIDIDKDDEYIIDYEFTKDNNYLVDEIVLNIKENIKASVIIRYISKTKSFHNLKLITNANKNSIVNITVINLLDEKSTSLISFENNIDESSFVTHNFIEIGGNKKISNYYSSLNGYKSMNNLNVLYVGNSDDIIDMNYYIGFNDKNENGNINVVGFIDDECYKSFKGTIDFTRGSSKSIGEESEKCILLSDEAKSRSLPMLLCHEEDVYGSHQVSTGKIDQDKLFYLMTRGLSLKEAKRVIIKASFSSVLDNIINDKIREELINEIDKRIK